MASNLERWPLTHSNGLKPRSDGLQPIAMASDQEATHNILMWFVSLLFSGLSQAQFFASGSPCATQYDSAASCATNIGVENELFKQFNLHFPSVCPHSNFPCRLVLELLSVHLAQAPFDPHVNRLVNYCSVEQRNVQEMIFDRFGSCVTILNILRKSKGYVGF